MKGIERLTVIANTYKTLIELEVTRYLLDSYREEMRMEGVTVTPLTKGFTVTHICAGVPGMEVQVPVKEKNKNQPRTMSITEATNKYEELINGGTLPIGDLSEMATAFRREGSRSTEVERRDLMYHRYYDCLELVDYCVKNHGKNAGLSDIERS